MPTTLRGRLTVAMAAVAAGVLLLASGLTWLGARGAAARAAHADLTAQVTRLQDLTRDLQRELDVRTDATSTAAARNAELLRRFIQVARGAQVSDARLFWVRPDGTILEGDDLAGLLGRIEAREPELAALVGLPDSLPPGRVDGAALARDGVDHGTAHGVAYRAELLGTTERARGASLAVVVTATVDTTTARRVAVAFAVAALIALAISTAVSAWFADRVARRLSAVGRTAGAIAGGDLGARVTVGAGAEAELQELAATINRMAGDLEAVRGHERAFLMSVSHDLRTPLTSIRGYAEALADGTIDPADDDARARAAAVITAEARRLERLVQDLLDLGRLDRREFSLHPVDADAAAIVADAAAGFVPQALALGIELVVISSGPIPARLDLERVAQIVANLVENALKYAATRVVVETVASERGLQVRVTDDGPGIPLPEAARVFDRLHTVRTSPGRSVGTGLGLAIVRELALAMGGTVATQPAATGGTTFLVELPR